MLEKITLSATTTGTTGSATGSSTSANLVTGFVHAAYLTVPTSGTATVTLAAQSAPSENILSLSVITASTWYYPRKQVCDLNGVALTYNGTAQQSDRFIVHDYLTLSATTATTAKTFQLDIFVEN